MGSPQDNSSSFLQLLEDFDIEQLAASDNTILGLWPDLTLAYLNQGWYRFAFDNGGEPSISENWSVGRCVMDAVPEALKRFYSENFAKCLHENRPWEHRYECSSPERIRKYHMLTFPVGRAAGLLVIHSLRQEEAKFWNSASALDQDYRNEHGFIIQCCHCYRVLRRGTELRWDWVSEWINLRPQRVSHGLCMPCAGFHYSSHRLIDTEFVQAFHTAE